MITDTVIAFVVLLSVLIFVHELGHFAVAKACGVRVLKFSLGFGPPIGFGTRRLRWVRGHTEYVVAWIPLGGFVKMLGENPGEEEDPDARAHPDETLNAKPLWQKLAIVFAGPAMNLALPILIFLGMQAAGQLRADAVVGLVEENSPAEAAGLRPGDRIAAIGAEPVRLWSELAGLLRDKPGESVPIRYERAGEVREAVLDLEARDGLDVYGVSGAVGWSGLNHSRPSTLVAVEDPASLAGRAGIQSGDRVVAVAGAEVEDWYALEAAVAAHGGPTVPVELERGVGGEAERLEVSLPVAADLESLGLGRASALIAEVMPDTPAERAGLEAGDLILEYAGQPVTHFAGFAEAVAASGGEPREMVYARRGATHRVELVAEPLDSDIGARYRLGIRGSDALVTGAVVVERVRNPIVAIPRAVEMTIDMTRMFLVGLSMFFTGEVSTDNLAGPIGIAQIAGDAFQRGWEPYLRIMVLISINLGILNLLPIPVLDGGQAMLFLVEGMKRSPLSLRTKLAVQQVGITMLMLLMGLAFWNDLSRLWSQMIDSLG